MNVFRIIRLFLSKEARDPLYVASANLISSIIGAIFWLILASIVEVSIYGEVNYYIATASLAAAFSAFGLGISSITYTAKGEKTFLLEALMLILVTSSIASIIVAFLLANIMLALIIIGFNIFLLTVADILGNKQYKRYPLFAITNRSMQLILSIALYYLIGLNGIIIGYAIPSLFLGSFILRRFKEAVKHIRFNIIRAKFKFIIHTYLFQISSSLLLFADKLILASLFGFETLGLYQLAFQLLMFLSIIPGSLMQYLLPQEASNVNRAFIKRLGLILSIALLIIFFLASPMLIDTFFPKYKDAIDAARIMAFGIIPMSINAITNARLLGRENSRIALFGSLAYIGSIIPLFIILGDTFGIFGLGLSVVLTLSIVL
jgi:O-antigen/teichoic acid export membrane protein